MFQLFDTASEKDKTAERIAQLRTHMRRRGLDAYLVPRADEHQGEYVPASSERLRWLTGFSGSAGFAVIGLDHAALFVDGRYVVQSRAEVDTSIFEILHVPAKGLKDWAADALKPGSTIGFDPWLVTLAQVEQQREDPVAEAMLDGAQSLMDHRSLVEPRAQRRAGHADCAAASSGRPWPEPAIGRDSRFQGAVTPSRAAASSPERSPSSWKP